jgi:hypothetical protein
MTPVEIIIDNTLPEPIELDLAIYQAITPEKYESMLATI